MQLSKIKISLSLAVAVILSGLVFSAGAAARIMPEPGIGSPVTHKQARKPAVKKATKRTDPGFPLLAGQHVRSQAELRTE